MNTKRIVAIVVTAILLAGAGTILNESVKDVEANKMEGNPHDCGCGDDYYLNEINSTEKDNFNNVNTTDSTILSPPLLSPPLFEDNFDDLNLDEWISFGSPLPQVLETAEGRYGVFDNNGDSWCASGVISKDNLLLSTPFFMESDIFLKVTDVTGCWASANIAILRNNSPTGNSPCPNEQFYMGILFGLSYVGDACWQSPPEERRHAYFRAKIYLENGTEEDSGRINADSYINAWYTLKISVGVNRIVRFYANETLIYTC